MEPRRKLRTTNMTAEPGGGGINVARAAAVLEGDVTAIFTSGGSVGREIRTALANDGIPSVPVTINEDSRRTFTVFDQETREHFRFIGDGPCLTEDESERFVRAVRDVRQIPSFFVLSGSLPVDVAPDIVRQIAGVVRDRGAKLCVDTSGEALDVAVKSGVDIITPSRRELGAAVGYDGAIEDFDFEAAARRLTDEGVGTVVATLGAEGAYAVSRDGPGFFAAAPDVEMVSTTGAGDSATAAFVHIRDQGGDTRQALQYSVAAGTAAVMRPGTQLCTRADTDQLINRVSVVAR